MPTWSLKVLFDSLVTDFHTQTVGYFVIPSAKKMFECLSVRPSALTAFIMSIYLPIFFKLCIGVHIRREWFGIDDG